MKELIGQLIHYKDIEYEILSVGKSRYTNFGIVFKVYVCNITTKLGGRFIDVTKEGKTFRFSPD